MRTLRSLFVVLLTPAVLLLAVACSSESGPPTSDVVSLIPWQGSESFEYIVKRPNDEVLGRATLAIDVQNGETTLSQDFEGEATSDKSSVVVDSETLKPISAEREIVAQDEDVLITVTYSEDGALIKQGDEKQSGLSVPEHAYDNDTSLFLWRTLAFEQGYEASYTTIITNQRSRQKVNLFVSRRETVEVAGREVTAWRLEISTSNADQVAWYADTPDRTLLRYDNSRGVIYELAE